MDILIKSYNRPYYLDRCLHSISKFVEDDIHSITILDDGTPQLFLDKIRMKYPLVIIEKSDKYEEKSKMVKDNAVLEIPISLWLRVAKKASDYFLLLEDDYWFTHKVNLTALKARMELENVCFLKLFWLGNSKLISGNIIKNTALFQISKPKLFTRSPFLYKLIFQTYGFKIQRIFSLLGIYSKDKSLKYYSLYSVAGALFKRDYFIELWHNHDKTINEGLQIFNALKYSKEHPNEHFAHTHEELLQTGFSTSATNSHKKFEKVHLDIFKVNHILNEAWLKEEFDVLKNFPDELNEHDIYMLLKENGSLYMADEWEKWTKAFKKQYENLGCKIGCDS